MYIARAAGSVQMVRVIRNGQKAVDSAVTREAIVDQTAAAVSATLLRGNLSLLLGLEGIV
jgi:hypothetical protein